MKVAQFFLPPHGLYSPWNSPGQNNGAGSLSLLQGIFPNQGSNPGLLHCRWIFLPAEPSEKPKSTGVGCHTLLQGIFLTQESNQGLLHCRWVLYQLSYQGSPIPLEDLFKREQTVSGTMWLCHLGKESGGTESCRWDLRRQCLSPHGQKRPGPSDHHPPVGRDFLGRAESQLTS